MIYKSKVFEVADKLQIDQEVALEAYQSFWKFIRETVKELPLKEDLTDKEFNKLQTNFNVPSLGKLNCTLERYKGVKKRFKHLKEL